MAWVRGIREVKQVEVDCFQGKGLRKGPVITRRARLITDLPSSAVVESVARTLVFLPEHTGAGPSGTHARFAKPRLRWGFTTPLSPFAWSIQHLVEPLRHHYATHVEPLHFGAKSGPRGRTAQAFCAG